MTNLSMILLWIATLIPDLLFWIELGKYLPHLYAAYSKYKAIGQYADWSKLILSPEEVQEFGAAKLQTIYTVAKTIASKYGSTTVTYIEGTSDSPAIKDIVRQAMNIVRVAEGARTIDVMALRNWRYNGFENKAVVAELDTGAGSQIVEEQANQFEPQQEERGLERNY